MYVYLYVYVCINKYVYVCMYACMFGAGQLYAASVNASISDVLDLRRPTILCPKRSLPPSIENR